tara:strand:+ start:38453 stop:39466 length:1014 start_codon:yes stop_codon:yes gene_type:complete
MALYLPESDALFIHIPKCGGFFVEEVLKHFKIEYTEPEPTVHSCRRHSRAEDYKKASFTFCTVRDLDSWMLSYWRFHMMMGKNFLIWEPNKNYPHRILGPPLSAWQHWSITHRETAQEYLKSMQVGCNKIIKFSQLATDLSNTLNELGYKVPLDQIKELPKANVTNLKVELGGGTRPYRNGYANIDIVEGCDFEWNLDDTPYPFPDDSVDAVYSSHCLEHLECPHRTIHEIVRMCRIGAQVEIRVPHPVSHMAMCSGHKHVVSPLMVENIDQHFPELYWKENKRLQLQSLTYGPTPWMGQAKEELPFLQGLDDQTIMKWIPNTCHESQFIFSCEKNS